MIYISFKIYQKLHINFIIDYFDSNLWKVFNIYVIECYLNFVYVEYHTSITSNGLNNESNFMESEYIIHIIKPQKNLSEIPLINLHINDNS